MIDAAHTCSTPEGLALHDHACEMASSAEEAAASAASFFARGLAEGSLCVHVHGARDGASGVRTALAARGIGVAAAESKGALAFISPMALQLRRAAFEPDEMLAFFAESIGAALRRGFSGVRIVVDMTWTLLGHPGSERVLELESKLGDFFPGQPFAAICQYDRSALGAELVRDGIRTHPFVVSDGVSRKNPHWVPSAEFLGCPDPRAEVERLLASLGERAGAVDELVNICAWCKSVRQGAEWERVERWAARRAGVTFSHAICPTCYAQVVKASS